MTHDVDQDLTSEHRAALIAFSRALGREAHVLRRRPDLLWQQMYNRLQWEEAGGWVEKGIRPEFDLRSSPGNRPWFHNKTRLQESPEFIHVLQGHTDIVTDCSFSPDGKTLISASVDLSIRLWNLQDGIELAVFLGHKEIVWACVFSPDGETIASASQDKTVRVWDVRTQKCRIVLRGHTASVRACAFSPDCSRILSASDDHTIKVWDVETGRAFRSIHAHGPTKSFWHVPTKGCATACDFHPDGSKVISAGDDRCIKLWNASAGVEPQKFSGHKDTINACVFSPDGEVIVSASNDSMLKVYSVSSGKAISTLRGRSGAVQDCAIYPDASRILSANDDGTIKVWNLSRNHTPTSLVGHSSHATSCAISPDGKRIASGSADKTLRLWSAEIGTTQVIPARAHQAYISACRYNPEGSRIVSASWDRTLKIWDALTGKELKALKGHDGFVTACAFAPDGNRIVSASTDHTLKIWDVKSGGTLSTLEGHLAPVCACAYSPSGAQIVSAGADRTLRIWDAAKEKHIATMKGHTALVYSCAYSPDGNLIFSASEDGTLKTWDTKTYQEVGSVAHHPGGTLVFSPDGEQFVTAGEAQSIAIRIASSTKEIHRLNGHTDWVRDCAYSSDGLLIFSVSSDKTIRVWESKSGKPLATFMLPNCLSSVHSHPYLHHLICGDTTGNLWRLEMKCIAHEAIIVSARIRNKLQQVDCPVCGKETILSKTQLGQTVTCSSAGCRQPLQVNAFILD